MKTSAIQPLSYVDAENKALPASLKARPQLQLSPGDVLVTRAGPRNRVGIACLVRSTRLRMMLCDKAYRLRVDERVVTPAFVEAMLNSPQLLAELEKLKSGISDSGLNLTQDRFLALQLPVPPIATQRRLGLELDSYLSRLDAAVAGLKRVQANLKRYRASVLKAAVEGKLVPTEAELAKAEGRSFEPASELLARILKERRARWEAAELASMQAKGQRPKDDKWKAKYQEPTAPDTKGLPELPDGWCWATLPQLIGAERTAMKTGPFGSLLKKHEHQSEGIPVVGIENIEPMRFVFGSKIHISLSKANELAGYNVEPGDVLVSRSGTVGEVCVAPDDLGPARFSTNVMRVRVLVERPFGEFLAVLLNGSPVVRSQIRRLCSGTTRDFLNQEILSSLIFPLPPLAEQQRIVHEIARVDSIALNSEADAKRDIKRCVRLRQSILKWAFEGKLVDQDPNDEPASALLERIRAERDATAPAKKRLDPKTTKKSKQPPAAHAAPKSRRGKKAPAA